MKTGKVTFKNHDTGEEKPVFIITPDNFHAICIVIAFGELLRANGAPEEEIAGVEKAADEMKEYYCENHCEDCSEECEEKRHPKEEKPNNRYKSHKEVTAFKIFEITEVIDGTFRLRITEESDRLPRGVRVTSDWKTKHEPKVSGYYVVYEDGYSSYSPAKAFEAGYTKI